MSEESVRTVVLKTMGDDNRPLRDLITNYLIFTIASALETSSMVDVYDLISACYRSFLSLYSAADAQWLTPLLMNLSYSLIRWANFADEEQPNAKELKISDAASSSHLSKALHIVIGDKSTNQIENSKRRALYYLANLTFRAYFKLRSTRLIPTVMANISNAGAALSEYPMSEQVTYRYYVGRYHLYQLDLRRAESDLAFAFRNCPDLSHDDEDNNDGNMIAFKNGRLILIYLTACRLCLGRMPSVQLLQEYGLDTYFEPLKKAIKLGDLSLLDQKLMSPELMSWFVEKELFFLLKEKLQVLCWRSLIRKTCLVSRKPTDPPQMRVQLYALLTIVRALTQDDSYDIYDVECITASLLDQGYIKGYIHSRKKILVLGKTNPFPIVYSVGVIQEVAS
ncbi:hypothetical protein BCR41DRAFT_346492 [Lobosporangium transversale]|uniref:PCI domain-containing protein n=1 Tax=Lobosporangium transversale TaxID=64571 RepID=A0A1Y2GZJ5_9FUNG|nr:hypothetical protein BCR41DRAFT_346492 [Lobosporangium transversale]ORZ27204.1 hypothetical protein BCR41DRAFT_346492 [Lobosporangium transversale]|eukprot:XP_021884931.1 hypothetical protein BCR41DRAFT_346492 [Lobosporangium transversale]